MGRWGQHKYLGDCQGRAPLVLQDVQADAAVRVNVAVVNTRREVHLWQRGRGQSVWVPRHTPASELAVLKPPDKPSYLPT